MAHVRQIEDFFQKHKGRSACVLGNGPSLLDHDLESLRKEHVFIGINKSWTVVQSSYHCFVAREHFVDLCEGKYSPGERHGDEFVPGVVFCTSGNAHEGRTRWLEAWQGQLVVLSPSQRLGDQVWWSADMSGGRYHSPWGGAFALELAAWMGLSPVYLLGYDAHNNEGHHWDTGPMHGVDRRKQIAFLKPVAAYLEQAGVEVFNANPKSAIRWFPFKSPAKQEPCSS